MGNLLHSGLHPGLDGRAPKTIAPTLFSKAKRKNITVQKALLDNRWIAHILPILTPQELNEYVTLWQAVSHTMLVENREDTISIGVGRLMANTRPRALTIFSFKGLSAS